jgi:hypothetical protein
LVAQQNAEIHLNKPAEQDLAQVIAFGLQVLILVCHLEVFKLINEVLGFFDFFSRWLNLSFLSVDCDILSQLVSFISIFLLNCYPYLFRRVDKLVLIVVSLVSLILLILPQL